MISVSKESDWVLRFAASPRAPVVAGVLLGAVAVAESVVHAVTRGVDVRLVLVVGLLAAATTVPLAILRPAPAAITATAAAVLSLGLFHSFTTAGLCAQTMVLYRLGRVGGHNLATFLAAPFLVLALLGGGYLAAFTALFAPVAVWLGFALSARGEAQANHAARQAVVESLREHTARGERARIARELHDVVAHHISMIAVMAETARLTTPGMPAAGAQRLSEIGDTARAGLTEMRRLLGVLREDAPEEAADRRPQPGLHQLNELLDQARETSGAGTRLIVSGSPADLDPGVELAAYRIIQEALTNARRHAPGAAVDVELHYTESLLRLRIRDNGPGPPGTTPLGGPGHGLTGMRERVAAVGGRLHTGATSVGGFLVEASLPAGAVR